MIKQILRTCRKARCNGYMGRRLRPKEGDGIGRVEPARGEYAVHVVSTALIPVRSTIGRHAP